MASHYRVGVQDVPIGLCTGRPEFAKMRAESKTLSENFSIKLEEGRISPRMRLPIAPSSKEMRLMREATTTRGVNYFNLPRPLWRKLKKCLPTKRKRTTKGGRPRASDRAVINAQIGTCFGRDVSGRPSTAIGSECPQAWSMNASRSGGRWASSRS